MKISIFKTKIIKSATLLVLMLVVMAVPLVAVVGRADALSGANFAAGHIIDDTIFTNNLALNVDDVQRFLNSKVPNCDTNGALQSSHPNGSGGYYTRAQWGAQYNSSNGSTIAATPYVCLAGYVENPSTHQNNLQNPGLNIPGGQTAAQIIINAAQTYQINPEVLIVTLQKEQGLVTDDWPWTNEYQIAMGYGCPDTAACDTTYYGFANQVTNAAKQFRNYLTNPANFNYTVGSNYVLYNPSAACGGSQVSIVNQATAALYDYTPYQPNASALANTSGSTAGGIGDGCSAYGNRNFWWYFNTWFGSTLASDYAWSFQGQSTYADSSRSMLVDNNQLLQGQRYYVTLAAKNVGNVTWTNTGPNPILVGTNNPLNRTSPFCDSAWLSCTRSAVLNEASVAPGQIGTFGFWIKAPAATGAYKETFDLVSENKAWMNDVGQNYQFTVTGPQYNWTHAGQAVYTDYANTNVVDPAQLITGQRYYVTLAAKNVGNVTWTNTGPNPILVGTNNPLNRTSPFCDSAWLSCTRSAVLNEASVAPGQIGTFGFWIKAPAATGAYKETFDLVSENKAWMNDVGQNYQFTVSTPPWQFQGQASYVDNTRTTLVDLSKLTAGQRVYLTLSAKNTGNTVWYNSGANPVALGTDLQRDRNSLLIDATWLKTNRPTQLNESSVAPGQIGTFGFWIKAPTTTGTYKEYFNLVNENSSWFQEYGQNYILTAN